ncbi:MAG: 3-dehydroquinate synthase [Pseudomonadales bacterium]|nr:3-dehydroquinate synthase [Pseudomonadales bacterium]
MRTLQVDLGDRSYPIHIGSGILHDAKLFIPHIQGEVMIVTNETVAPLYLETLKATLAGLRVNQVILPDGEAYKNLDTINEIFTQLLTCRHSRRTTLVALGGGVIGDMTGFAAACYQRGVDFIQVPTTLLSQVDSSVGGKTGVNHPAGKNMIGAFHQPNVVVIDTDTLKTLPERELSAGIAEVIKYGLIRDSAFLSWLDGNVEDLLKLDESAISYAIEKSCQCKAEIVGLDEKEAGIRAILNLGHTFGHAIESHCGYGNWLHGEAVGAGMIMAAAMSRRLGWLDQAQFDMVKSLILRAKLPGTGPAGMSVESYRLKMAVDKKNIDGLIRLVLLKGLGEADMVSDYPPTALDQTLIECTPSS